MIDFPNARPGVLSIRRWLPARGTHHDPRLPVIPLTKFVKHQSQYLELVGDWSLTPKYPIPGVPGPSPPPLFGRVLREQFYVNGSFGNGFPEGIGYGPRGGLQCRQARPNQASQDASHGRTVVAGDASYHAVGVPGVVKLPDLGMAAPHQVTPGLAGDSATGPALWNGVYCLVFQKHVGSNPRNCPPGCPPAGFFFCLISLPAILPLFDSVRP